MTVHTRLTQGQMNSLKLQTVNAMFTVFDREIEARDARNADLARKLYSNRETLRTVVLELRRAEVAFQNSNRPPSDAELILGETVRELKRARRQMERLETVNTGATRAIDLLRQLPPALR